MTRNILAVSFSLIVTFGIAKDAFASDGSLKEFESDACTFFAEGPSNRPELWSHCCFEHDLRYWFGGAREDRDFADQSLKTCVQAVAGKTWARIIYSAVRVGHLSPFKHRLAWSWGWHPKRKNSKLTVEEEHYVCNQLWNMELDAEMRQKFIEKFLHCEAL